MKNHHGFIILVLAIFLSLPAFAARHSGFVQRAADDSLYLYINTNERPAKLISENSSVQGQLRKLSTGDFISLFGTPSSDPPQIQVSWIEFVGLRDLIGLWTNEAHDHIFEFRTFSDMNLYRLDPGKPKEPATKIRFSYNIAPGNGSVWKVFLSDQNSVTIGSIMLFGDASAALAIYENPQNHSEVELFELQKVTPHYFHGAEPSLSQ